MEAMCMCLYASFTALGMETLGSELTQEQSDLHRWAAEGLTTWCYLVYAEAEGGLVRIAAWQPDL
ncbi:uncharacterized protein EI90DRAFT_3053520 [Cantharellus anzutake]|uniref:uncharacterized protein n=1 Tax=Cantharellus anzutake TaxID=1750568 RepID=UPI0019044E80|nr:uncharacterized protein EI90DRAFT_3053520 [Cantharellus anzutake]KAF8333236.1 hypothetical protein EI90DRAFT_3053520 [Cantharellus anzutake]